MRKLSSSALLRVWEEGYGEPSYRRALLLLAEACPDEPLDKLAKLSIGSRDARLLTLREWTFGPELPCLTACPNCRERLEFKVSIPEIRTDTPESNGDTLQLTVDGYHIDFRLPCTADLIKVSGCGGKDSMRTALIRSCIQRVHRINDEVVPEETPVHVLEAIITSMAKHDPQADMQLSLTCPGCAHRWSALFDIVSFFWSEIQSWSLRMLRDVHTIASAYGWPEKDILAMSPRRRQLYLQVIGT